MTVKRIVLPPPGKPSSMSFSGIVATHKPGPYDLLVIKSASAQGARLAFRPGDPDFKFSVHATESIVIEIHPIE